ncbi:B3 domain-containing protein os07g0563300 [Phtheirospermum japonicum]|uniref:B3 domain-containing protein os07g0563300 n=1 Tax=Phtheirospermum japonicum TaxID=374723 RepID=A0A830D103_9LAMI|nr:B3 domain-containing protein os07g0563300 [Phtheirospermum japonicum]
MLSASDAGRIGRLVVPKKCAEAYLPQISQPEGLPLKVQDVQGKEWVFQFRFWPNNNSRMYVLEGITPCIQSMQLQAGDVVTFSRLDPEGKLVMGCRKASAVLSSDQGKILGVAAAPTAKSGDEVTNTIVGSDASNLRDVTATNKPGDVITVNGHTKAEKMLEDKPIIQSKRKSNNLGAKNKRLRIVSEDAIQLNLTWREAQGLMRPPEKIVPSIFVVEGCEFEEFEGAAPVIGRPTIHGTDDFSAKIQWVQCEDCFKWRKVPVDALLPSRWICSDNAWDPDRSQCSSAEELTKEQLEHMLPMTNTESSSNKLEIDEEVDTDLFVALEGLDKLANLAINEENANENEAGPASSSENTTKHPRHKPGCVCIVCLQPPSGKGSKHDQSCECVVCSALKRRFRTLTERRERKQLEQETETYAGPTQLPEKAEDLEESSVSPLKGQIDLNIQPEREEESSPGSGVGGPMSFAQRCFRRMLGR